MSVSNRKNVYYDLLKEVGIQGKYQTLIIVFCCFLCFLNGFIALGTPYYFAIAPYTNCPAPYQGSSLCNNYVCSLPHRQRTQYLQPEINKLRTLGNEFGDLHCQNSDFGEMAKGIPFIGTMVGAFVTGFLGDNFGRRLTTIFCIVVGILGYSIVIFSKTLTVASIGLFFSGFGVESCFNLSTLLASQTLQNHKRQRVVILTQAFFCLAGLVTIFAFYLIKDWKTMFIWFGVVPLIFSLAFTLKFVRETPLFLIKLYQVEQIRQNLRFIADINQQGRDFDKNHKLSHENIENLKKEYQSQINESHSTVLTVIDLFRFKSVRVTSICLAVICFSVNVLYYAPMMLIDRFGFDFYLNGVFINTSEMLTYLFSYFFVETIQRRKYCLIFLGTSLLCSFGLLFLETKQICTNDCFSTKVIFELTLITIMRFAVALQFEILLLHVVQLYPVQIVSTGMGFNALASGLAHSFINLIINTLKKHNISIMILFMLLSLLSILVTLPLDQTIGMQPRERVQEIEFAQQQSNNQEYAKEAIGEN